MKTAMQELIEYTENLKSTYDFSFDKFFTKANELLEKEKEHIIEAFKRGLINEMNGIEDLTSEKYYNETFNNYNMKNKSNFCPNRIKLMLEVKGYPRITDTQLSIMLGYEIANISVWKNKSPELLDRIHNACNRLELNFNQLMQLHNRQLVYELNMHSINASFWDKKRPKVLVELTRFFEETGLTFEDIYKKNS